MEKAPIRNNTERCDTFTNYLDTDNMLDGILTTTHRESYNHCPRRTEEAYIKRHRNHQCQTLELNAGPPITVGTDF